MELDLCIVADRLVPTLRAFERYVEAAGQGGRLYAVSYDEDELGRQVSQVEVPLKERGRRPEDGAHGAGAAENVLQFKVDSRQGRLETESPEDPAEATGEGGGSEPRGTLRHYLYVSDEGKAEALAAAVRKLGHSTEVREPAGPGSGWLVLVTDRDPFGPEVQDRREREFMELVSRYEGEYDGSEIAVWGSGLCQRKDRGTRGRPPPRPRESSRPPYRGDTLRSSDREGVDGP